MSYLIFLTQHSSTHNFYLNLSSFYCLLLSPLYLITSHHILSYLITSYLMLSCTAFLSLSHHNTSQRVTQSAQEKKFARMKMSPSVDSTTSKSLRKPTPIPSIGTHLSHPILLLTLFFLFLFSLSSLSLSCLSLFFILSFSFLVLYFSLSSLSFFFLFLSSFLSQTPPFSFVINRQ